MSSFIKRKKGFTLIEFTIVLSLLGIVLALVFTLYYFTQTGFNKNNAISAISQKMNTALLRIQKDIHNASKPNSSTNAVYVESNRKIYIYTYNSADNVYSHIVYLFDPDNGVLKRGSVNCSTDSPPPGENPVYGSVTDWETLIDGAVNTSNGKTFGFEDITEPNQQSRAIRITIIANDLERPLKKPIHMERVISTR
jgi:prepilin-type N-terminal cleavage/methylation domain-containing protein